MPDNLINCGAGESVCTVCDLVQGAENFLNLIVFGSVLFAALLFVNAGALYIFSGANPSNVSRAHRIFSNTLIGIVIILTAWVVVDVIMGFIYNDSWGPWNTILCKT